MPTPVEQRGKPQQNAFIETFNGRLRDEPLNETLFTSLAQARAAQALWRDWRTDSTYGWIKVRAQVTDDRF